MKVGFSLSPGGLLLPYHLGVLDGLQYHQMLDERSPLAGASAGAIAVATNACSLDSKLILDDTIDIANACRELGSARGNLLPLLREKLEHHVDEDRFRAFQERSGEAVFTYHELFPSFRPVHESMFEHKQELIDTVCHSSAFPFFSSNWPAALDPSKSSSHPLTLGGRKLSLSIPRLVVDGFFAVPGDRFGCPDFDKAQVPVDRTVCVTGFPRQAIGFKGAAAEDCICPDLVDDGLEQSLSLLRKATQPCSASEIIALYDSGFQDAEKWCRNEQDRQKEEWTRLQTATRIWNESKE